MTEVDYIEVGKDSRYTHSISSEKSFSLTPEIFRIPRFSHNKREEEGAFLTISAFGSALKDDIFCFLTYHNRTGDQGVEIKMEKFNEGKIATFKESDYKYEDETAYYEMLCYGIPGDLVKIDTKSTVLDNPSLDNEIIPGAEGVTGFLNSDMPKDCYKVKPISEGKGTYYVNYLIFTGKGLHYLTNETGSIIEDSKKMVVKNGVISLPSGTEDHTCIALPEGDSEVIYYMQITDFSNKAKQNVFEPQNKGTIYQREIPSKGAAFFSYMGYETVRYVLSYYMKTIEGTSHVPTEVQKLS